MLKTVPEAYPLEKSCNPGGQSPVRKETAIIRKLSDRFVAKRVCPHF
jgi:hypothetical protein